MTKKGLIEENTLLKAQLDRLTKRKSAIVLDEDTRFISINYGEHRDQELNVSINTIWYGGEEKTVLRLQCEDMLGIVGNAQNSFYIATKLEIKKT